MSVSVCTIHTQMEIGVREQDKGKQENLYAHGYN